MGISILLRDRHGDVALRALSPEMLANHMLRGRKCSLEYVHCDVLARVGTAVLNKFMGTTGRAQNIGWERDEVTSMVPCPIRYFRDVRSADEME
jgi:hypothetical protein